MKTTDPHSFSFHEALDSDYLQELFAGDLTYASEIFDACLQDLPQYWGEITQAYDAQNLNELRAAAHRCKPLFGYVGHTHMTNLLQEFEQRCSAITSFSELETPYQALVQAKEEAVAVIRIQHDRLVNVNRES